MMFTGLVAAIGKVSHSKSSGGDQYITITPTPAFSDLVKGESIAVNGACLTVETFDTRTFTVFASQETLQATNLQRLLHEDRVNLERAMVAGGRFGGHMVSGHVDAMAVVKSITSVGRSQKIRISFPKEFASQVIPKGSIALDGISLTINICGPDFLEVNIIPETQTATTISQWKPGAIINFETDIIGKYVQQVLAPKDLPENTSSGLTVDFLRENGF